MVEFRSEDGPLRAVDHVSFSVGRGEIVGLVGESGAGKTLTSEAILGLIRCPPGRVGGEVRFRGHNLLALDERTLADIRGKEIAMIFQNPGRLAESGVPRGRSAGRDDGAASAATVAGPCGRRAVEILAKRGDPVGGGARFATIRTSSRGAWPSA